MAIGLEKVCTNCGSERFLTYESIRQTVVIDGNGDTIDVHEVHSSKRDGVIKCIECNVSTRQSSLVTAQYFHEVIAIERGETL